MMMMNVAVLAGVVATLSSSTTRVDAFSVPAPRMHPGLSSYTTTTAPRPSWELTASLSDDDDGMMDARKVFALVDTDGSNTICRSELGELLNGLSIAASPEEIDALFGHLDRDGDGEIDFEEEFQPWYSGIVESTLEEADQVRAVLLGRRTVNNFDDAHQVDDQVLFRAIECAIAAPNHKLTEPWRFIKVGRETVQKIAALNASAITDEEKAKKKRARWESIPGWCVVTSALQEDDRLLEQEDYAATCCAVQNFMLSMWSEGVGTKWTSGDITRTKEFADLCGVQWGQEQVVGCIWYGFEKNAPGQEPKPKKRKRTVYDVLTEIP